MAKQLAISILVDLPADHFEAAKVSLLLSEPWIALREALDKASVTYRATADEMEVRARPGRPRKPKKDNDTKVSVMDAFKDEAA